MTPENTGNDRLRFSLAPVQALVLSYIVVILAGFILLSLPAAAAQGRLSLLDALFTSTSATCVTGLTVVSTRDDLSFFGQLVVLAQFQIGGLGIMSFSTLFALLLGKKIHLRGRLLIQEDLNQFSISGLVRLLRYVLLFVLIIESLGIILLFSRFISLYPVGTAFYKAVFHAVSAFNNAGFDVFGNSLESFSNDFFVQLVMIALIILGGLGFAVLAEIVQPRSRKRFSLTTRLVLLMTGFLLLAGLFSILSLEWNNPDTLGNLTLPEKIANSFFLSVTSRTAGFNTIPTDSWRVSTLLLVIFLMFIGASPGSTGGGVKTTTLAVLFLAMKTRIKGYDDMEIFNRRLDGGLALKAFSLVTLAGFWIISITFFLSIFENFSLLEMLFEATSAFGTVGLSTGITGDLSNPSKGAIILTMLLGRVGPMSFALALGMRHSLPRRRLPEGKVVVG